MAPFLRPQRRRLVVLAVISAVGGFAEAAVLVLIARIAFALTARDSHIRIGPGAAGLTLSLPAVIGTAAILVLVRGVLQAVQAHLGASAFSEVLRSVRSSLSRRYLAASWSLQSAEREGRLQELLTTYTMFAANAVMSLSLGTVAAFNLLALMITALIVNAIAAIGVALAATIIGFCLRPIRRAVRRRSRFAADANLEFATSLTELSTTTQEVRVFGVEGPVGDRIDAFSNHAAANYRRMRYFSGLATGLYQAAALFIVVAALGGAYAADITGLGTLGAVVLLMVRSLSYGQAVQTTIQTLHESIPYLETLTAEETRYRSAALPCGGSAVDGIGQLQFDHVGFEYVPGTPALRDVSFAVGRGEVIGVVGPSGAGKSTLVQLLLRLREPTRGRILADGRDVHEIAFDDWYRHVTFVPQDAHLFAGTVAENIAFFRDGTDRGAVERAAKHAHVHDEIISWVKGYDTSVGERGSEISGGQRQRLCIARALVDEPDLVVLDEPTSALDARSEALIRETIMELSERTTVFVIAHRLSTLTVCDRIMVMRGGQVQGFDAPARLEESDPFYREALRLSGMR